MDEAQRVSDWEIANQISHRSPVGPALRALQQLEMSRLRST
jgi:hypothetical protein